MFAKEKIKGEGRPRKPLGVRGLAVLVVAVLVSLVVAVVPASAAGSVIDCSQLSYIQAGSNRYSFNAVKYGQSDVQLAGFFGANAIWYQPLDSTGESSAQISDYEMHFDIGTQINTGDTYTLTYDMFFPEYFNSNSQLVMPGFDFSYVASVNGRWVTLPVHGDKYWHWQGSATVTAGFSTSEVVIIPRGLQANSWVVVNTLKVSIAGKDYSGAINNTKDEIKANADKNASEIKDNNDKNTDRIIDNQKELQDKEKSEAGSGGSAAADKASNAIPGVDSGFLNAIKSFVATMSYSGTEAKLQIPRLYIPALGGLFDEITLLDSQSYDLSKAITDFLPEIILTLIQYLFTVAFIVYCVKELYGTIEYVLTLRKGTGTE